MTSELKYEVDDDPVLKTTYGYTDGNLTTVKLWENRAPAGEPADWGDAPISTTFYSYHPGSNRMRHVIPPQIHRQMMNNGIDPEEATESQLNEYAASEFAEYDANNRVTLFYTSGRRYQQTFSYRTNPVPPASAFTGWASCTEVVRADGSVMSCYYNRSGQLMLKMVQDGDQTWYPLCQQFEEGSGRILLSASGSAIEGIDEGTPTLVNLSATVGKITVYDYTAAGYLQNTKIQNGTSGTLIPQEKLEYQACPETANGTIYMVNKRTTYRDDAGTQEVVTTYSYDYHSGTNQISKKTTHLPVVPTSENGTGASYQTESHFDTLGALIKIVDQLGVATTYEYDAATGGMTKMTQDPTGLNLVTDYELDRRGRTILTLGPEHEVDLAGTPTALRTCRWTYFQDDIEGTWTFNGYRTTVGPAVDQIVGPVSINRPNLPPPADMAAYAGWRQSSLIQAVYDGEGIPAPDTVFGQETWTRWTVGLSDRASEYKEQWTYFNIPLGGYGHQSENYGRKLLAYDSVGRQNWTMCAGATIDQTTFNAMGWPVQEELGTVAGLSVTTVREFDANGNVTQVTAPVDTNTANDRVTTNTYDFRNRLETSARHLDESPFAFINGYTYDNRDLLTSQQTFKSDTTSPSNVIARTDTDYDALENPFRTRVYQNNGDWSNPQISQFYYDASGRLARSAPSGSKLFIVRRYDSVGRIEKIFRAWPSTGDNPLVDPSSIVHAVVMDQKEMNYDEASNLLSEIHRQRFDDTPDVDTGELGDSSISPKARVSYIASYADAVGHLMATSDYGTNGGGSWSRSQTTPLRSDTVLVTSTLYDAAGNTTVLTNAAGISNSRVYDDAGRLITTVENDASFGFRATHYEYTDDGWLTKLKCENPDTGLQITEWVRGVSIAQGSSINSNRLVFQKIYPNSTGASDRVTSLYNRQLQTVRVSDPNGTIHAYSLDKLGRLLVDQVEEFGQGIDATIGRVTTVYSDSGFVESQTSFSVDGTSSINQVIYDYNFFNQLKAETQKPNGSSELPSVEVSYEYEDGSSNTLRMTKSSIVSSKGVAIQYGSVKADALSRPDQINYEFPLSYFRTTYLGVATLVDEEIFSDGLPAIPIAKWTMKNGATGDAGDKYTGLDRFGRRVEIIWENADGKQVHSRYGRNRVGGIEWRRDEKAHAMSVNTQDSYYWYDDLQQVRRHDRGNLIPSFGPYYTGIENTIDMPRSQQEIFVFDESANWNSTYKQEPSFSQSRVNNQSNQIVSLDGPSGVIQPAYDLAGNMISIPTPKNPTMGYELVWDAWNRLVRVKDDEGSVLAVYSYDSRNRRVKSVVDGIGKIFIYDNQWRVIEERLAETPTIVDRQYGWNPFDRWDLIRRVRSTEGVESDELVFPLKDYFDPVALIDRSGSVIERYDYDAFGAEQILSASFEQKDESSYEWTFLFHAEFKDLETGLYNYGFRFYHTGLGRWCSRDILGEAAGSNMYCMLGNNPVNSIDQFGLSGLVFYFRPTPVVTPETLTYTFPRTVVQVPEVVSPRYMPLDPLPPGTITEPSSRWAPYPNPTSPQPEPDEDHDHIDWDMVDRWTQEPNGVNEKQDRRQKVNDCCRLHDKYKNIQDKRPTGENTCEDMYQKSKGLINERKVRMDYIKEGCDDVPWSKNPKKHDAHAEALRNELKNLKARMKDRGCWDMDEFDWYHLAQPGSRPIA
ncbi:RHS repeat-associated core domain-containing protein [Luteolibacter ambystomatis]|uniref:RHS repeat domain-containing protein n=1 Tax=Luteolibacter ambystomatis TaxID=2824561 RepID=UPI00363C3D8A